jgi:HlyD family secretion protein
VAVQTGQRGGGYVQIVRGPPAGALVVQNAASFLLDGDMVKPTVTAGAVPAAKAPAKAAR